MALKISPNTVGLMAATMLPVIDREDIEDMMFRAGVYAYGNSSELTLKQIALRKAAELACDLAHAIEEEMELREAVRP